MCPAIFTGATGSPNLYNSGAQPIVSLQIFPGRNFARVVYNEMGTPAEFATFVNSELHKIGDLIRQAGIKQE